MNPESPHPNSIPGLLRELRDETTTLLRQEVKLAKTELKENVSRMGSHAAHIAIGGFVYIRTAFQLEKSPTVVEVLEDDSTRELDVLLIGADNAYVFAGLGGPYWIDSNNDGKVDANDTPDADGAIGVAIGGMTFRPM